MDGYDLSNPLTRLAIRYLMVAISIAVAHLHRVVVGVDLGGAQRVLRVGIRPRLIGGGGELGAAVV